MNKQQFVKLAKTSGYANIETIKEYAKKKENFTDDDFIAVYRMQEERDSKLRGLPKGTSKRLSQSAKMGSDRV
jgi:hypothetical protein